MRGGGIYPTASLLNHECLPNVARYARQIWLQQAWLANVANDVMCNLLWCQTLTKLNVSCRFDDFDGPAPAPDNMLVRFRTLHAVPKGRKVVHDNNSSSYVGWTHTHEGASDCRCHAQGLIHLLQVDYHCHAQARSSRSRTSRLAGAWRSGNLHASRSMASRAAAPAARRGAVNATVVLAEPRCPVVCGCS